MFWYRLGMADSRSLSERLSKLPPGRHLIPRDFVSQNQRERMLLATAELVAGSGLVLEDAGTHELKGLPGARQLFRVAGSVAEGPAA